MFRASSCFIVRHHQERLLLIKSERELCYSGDSLKLYDAQSSFEHAKA